jgi:WD40 repeat protein
LGDDAVVLGFQNSSAILTLSKQEQVDVWTSGAGAAYDARGGHILLAGYGTLALVDPKTAKPIARWQAEVSHGSEVCFSPDGALAVVASSSTVELWDTKGMKGIPKGIGDEHAASYELPKGKPVASLRGHEGWVYAARMSRDGIMLVTGDSNGKLSLWSLPKRTLLKSVSFKGDSVFGADFSEDGASVVVGLDSGKVVVLDLRGKTLRGWKTREQVFDVRVLAGGAVATLGVKALTLWDGATGRSLATLARKSGHGRPKIADVRGDLLLLRGPLALVRVV